MYTMSKIAILGACGRMGRRLVTLCHQDKDVTLHGAVEGPNNPLLNQDAGLIAGVGEIKLAITNEIPADTNVMIDFSIPEATRQALKNCVSQGVGLVIGTTGLTEDDHKLIDDAAKTIPVLQAPNMSLGVNLLFALAAQVAKQLGDDYDIEIIESHHRFKKDSPSGTALGIAQAICDATGKDIEKT